MQLRGDRPFQFLEKINDNVYKLDLPRKYGNISTTFNVANLSFFDVGDESNLRTNTYEEGENDEGATSLFNDRYCKVIKSFTKRYILVKTLLP